MVGKTKKNGTVGAFGKAGKGDTICISLLRDVSLTAKKLYLSDPQSVFIKRFYPVAPSKVVL